jgi:hypothetical protein
MALVSDFFPGSEVPSSKPKRGSGTTGNPPPDAGSFNLPT